MGRMQQAKGKAFEKLVARLIGRALRDHLVRNMDQTGEDAGRDLLTSLPFCIQCEHARKVHIYQKLKDAKASARPGELAVAVVRRDRQPILAVMSLADWLELVKAALRDDQ